MDVTTYTHRIILGIRAHFESEDAQVIRGRGGKLVAPNSLPFIHHLYIEAQRQADNFDLDFTDAVLLMDFYRNYLELIAEINKYTEFVPTRANFCAYLGINTDMYGRLLQNNNPEVKNAMRYVEDYFVSLLQVGSLMGDVGSNAAKMILQTSGQYGYNQVTTKEAADIRAAERRVLSQEELEANLKRITAGK